jgi:hypothetical protein
MTSTRISRENAVLLAKDLTLRERLDLKNWELRQMRLNVLQIRKILGAARWEKKDVRAHGQLMQSLDELEDVIREKDATRVDASHTHLEEALSELSKSVFGV